MTDLLRISPGLFFFDGRVRGVIDGRLRLGDRHLLVDPLWMDLATISDGHPNPHRIRWAPIFW